MLKVHIELTAAYRGKNIVTHAAKVLDEHMTITSMAVEGHVLTIDGTTDETFAQITAAVYSDSQLSDAVRNLKTDADPLELSTRAQRPLPKGMNSHLYADHDPRECEGEDCPNHGNRVHQE